MAILAVERNGGWPNAAGHPPFRQTATAGSAPVVVLPSTPGLTTARLFDIAFVRANLSTRSVRTRCSVAIDKHSAGVTDVPACAEYADCSQRRDPTTSLTNSAAGQSRKAD